jgi:hypothetical protein
LFIINHPTVSASFAPVDSIVNVPAPFDDMDTDAGVVLLCLVNIIILLAVTNELLTTTVAGIVPLNTAVPAC